MRSSFRPLALAACATAGLLAPATAQNCGGAGEVYSQCPDTVGFSISDPSVGVNSADDFQLGAAASLETIRWWGTYSNAAGTIYCGPQTDQFTVQFWADSGGSGPDGNGLIADVSAQPITRSASPVFTMDVGGETYSVFEYELDLSSAPLAVPAGVKIWLQVTNDLLPFPNCKWGWILDARPSNGYYTYSSFQAGLPPWSQFTFPTATPGFDFSFALLEAGSVAVNYCTAGTSASGCNATLSASGTPSATAATGFTLIASGVEGNKDGLYFLGTNGRQASPWGNGSSYQCVVPPVRRAGLLVGVGTNGACDGMFAQDLNARWTAIPAQNPGAGALVQGQLWHRDVFNTSNQTTSLSDAIEFVLGP